MKKIIRFKISKILLSIIFIISFNITKSEEGCSPSWPFGCPVFDIEYYPDGDRVLCYEGGNWHCSDPNNDQPY